MPLTWGLVENKVIFEIGSMSGLCPLTTSRLRRAGFYRHGQLSPGSPRLPVFKAYMPQDPTAAFEHAEAHARHILLTSVLHSYVKQVRCELRGHAMPAS